MNADERAGHGRIARQEKWAAFFNEASEAITDCIHSHVRPAVTDSNNDGGWFAILCHSVNNNRNNRDEKKEKIIMKK